MKRYLTNIGGHLFFKTLSIKQFPICRSFITAAHSRQRFQLDYDYLCNEKNLEEIKFNIEARQIRAANIDRVLQIYESLKNQGIPNSKRRILEDELEREAAVIPNKGHPRLKAYGEEPHAIKYVNEKAKFDFKPKKFERMTKNLNLFRMDDILSRFSNHRSYYLRGALAQIEQALIKYTVSKLLCTGFKLISVPDILPNDVLERCGMQSKFIRGDHSQIYSLDEKGDKCLSGTAEMGIGAFLQNKAFNLADLPVKLASVSRCFRKEIGASSSDKGIFRVNYFTKVEMFGITADETGTESNALYEEFVELQIDLFSQLGIHFKVLDMPLKELALPAYTKTDIEAWIPGEKVYKELSSASNCTDFQSRRLLTRYKDQKGNFKFVHTVNGTACAIPRCLLTLVSTHRENIPGVLQPYLKGAKTLPIHKTNIIKNFNPNSYPGVIVEPR